MDGEFLRNCPLQRSHYLGASEIACILGISPFGDKFKVWYGKTHPKEFDSTPTGKMQLGLDTEDFVLTQFEKRFNTTVTRKQERMHHWLEDWAGCTLDGMAVVNGEKAVIEAKTIGTSIYNTPPEYYVIQVLWQQWVAGVDQGYLVVWSTKDLAFETYAIHIADHQAKLTEAVQAGKEFWMNHVLTGIPPERNTTERQDKELPEDLLEEYCHVQDQIKDLTVRKDILRQQIVEAMGCPSDLKSQSSKYQLDITTTQTKRLNSKKLESDNPTLVQNYFETSSSQRVVAKRLSARIS